MADHQKKNDDLNVRNIGDGSAWDTGREASIGHGTHSISDTRSADAETPGVQTRDADPDEPDSGVNRDE